MNSLSGKVGSKLRPLFDIGRMDMLERAGAISCRCPTTSLFDIGWIDMLELCLRNREVPRTQAEAGSPESIHDIPQGHQPVEILATEAARRGVVMQDPEWTAAGVINPRQLALFALPR
jgi:hypothetical protein